MTNAEVRAPAPRTLWRKRLNTDTAISPEARRIGLLVDTHNGYFNLAEASRALKISEDRVVQGVYELERLRLVDVRSGDFIFRVFRNASH